MSIGKRLKDLRVSKDYTLEYVGKLIGVSKQTLFKYENSIVANIPSDKIEALATLYGSTPQFIMGWDDAPNKSEQKMLDTYLRLKNSDDPDLRALATAVDRILGLSGRGDEE